MSNNQLVKILKIYQLAFVSQYKLTLALSEREIL